MAEKILLTAESKAELEKRLEELKGKGRAEIAAKLEEARSFGDLSENAEYDLARDEQAKMEREISDLENRLHNAEIIRSENMSTETIGVGNTVSFRLNGEDRRYQIVGSQDSDPVNNKISNESPIGKALLGRKKGEKFRIKIKTGKHEAEKEIEIVNIEA